MSATKIKRHERKFGAHSARISPKVLIGIWRLTDERETPRTIYCRGR